MSYDQAQTYYSYYGGSPAGYYGDTYSYYNETSSNAQYGYFYQHISLFDAAGLYDHEVYESKGPNFETLNEYTKSYDGGVYTFDTQHTVTPLDGVYESYGSRETSSYNANYATASYDDVSFSSQQSYAIFSSYDYATGASVLSYDSRSFYGSGFYEYNRSFYSGPGGSSAQYYASYHYSYT